VVVKGRVRKGRTKKRFGRSSPRLSYSIKGGGGGGGGGGLGGGGGGAGKKKDHSASGKGSKGGLTLEVFLRPIPRIEEGSSLII